MQNVCGPVAASENASYIYEMILDQSSMDLATLVHKIKENEIDLQPDFQRGTVWPESKKKRLIDTILRRWYVPAIHIVVNDDIDREEVLDGQQRLQTILEFFSGKLRVDGRIEPFNEDISKLHGLYFKDLPTSVRSKVKRFSINTIRLRDYSPDEPGELFFRLNQLTALTAAEQRNALVGEPRNQVKQLSKRLEKLVGWALGFSNARMNYDDVLSRLAFTLEEDDLALKITSALLERRYRTGEAFDKSVVTSINSSVGAFHRIISNGNVYKHNKATLFSWLFFLCDNRWIYRGDRFENLQEFYGFFESMRSTRETPSRSEFGRRMIDHGPTVRRALLSALDIFNDRSTSRVNDVSSILLRDLVLNLVFFSLERDDERKRRLTADQQAVLDHAVSQLSSLSDDIAEQSLVEADLARAWGTYRA